MTNIIPIKPLGESSSPLRAIDALHILYDKLARLDVETMLLSKQIQCNSAALDDDAAAHRALAEARRYTAAAADQILDAVAQLMIECTANIIVPPRPDDQVV
ncbi:MAG: hypothetical protein KDJ17_07170 [Hyphomicrobiaceae bacterium]|nr:hypothetical protein [Hyphomicrobiaceae bacterium]